MNGERIAGALQYPAYLLVWSIGIAIFAGGFYRADAALVTSQLIAFEPLATVPSLVAGDDFRVDLDLALDATEVMAGAWQPALLDKKAIDEIRIEEPRIEEPRVEPKPVAKMAAEVSMVKRTVSAQTARVDEQTAALRREARKALARGESGHAFRLLMRNVAQAGNDVEYLALLAVSALEERLPREAMLVYEKLIKLERTDSRWWMGLALCQERLGVDATTIYEEVVRLTDEGSDLQRLALERIDLVRGVT